MKKAYNRRVFLKDSSKAALAAGIGISLIPSVVVAATGNEFEQQPLPYGYAALEPYIDAMTMEIHFTKHAAAYAKNLADACAAEKVNMQTTSVETLMKNISKYSIKMRNNGGGHFNHEFFWKCMKPGTANQPSGILLTSINQSFGSFESFKNAFADAGKSRFGSGWAWLVQTADGNLKIGSTPNQDNPLMDISELKGTPLLGLDVWEHAYYLKYQNKRPDYINNWFNIVNWDFVAGQLK
ncbi:superoxide dismutase [Sediminibacterium sp. TEGAF015]|uniref:superoxide dismutase n=1 Tax=Sediminibacterium sp. TEGAF015 TaxID=575378 RepID=UPI0021FAC07C|nr:superoxide dismutase [Sediminibacterium sp. TEGAF015]BDQ13156.1 superoxide dismutase [Sediminibacterium sp. TEGAF015]